MLEVSVSVISWKRIKRLNRQMDESFVHAYTRRSPVWVCVRHDGSSVIVNADTATVEGEPAFGSVMTSLLKSRDARTESDRKCLQDFDDRSEEWRRHR